MRVIPAVCAALLATSAFAVPHETIRSPAGWTKGEVTGSDLQFTVALKHSTAQKEWLKENVKAVSTPGSKHYGKYMSLEDLSLWMTVSQETVNVVKQEMVAAGFNDVSLLRSKDMLQATASAKVASEFFKTEFCLWTNAELNLRIIRACELSYDLPAAMSANVDFVSGLVHFPSPQGPHKGNLDVTVSASDFVENIRKTYNMESIKASSGKSTTAFTQFIGQMYNDADVASFLKHYLEDQEGQTVAKKVGPTEEGHGTEALLDAEYLLGMGNGVETWVWTNQNKNTVNNQEPWAEFFTNVSNDATVPNLFSISYGEGEDTVTKVYMDRCDLELQKAAARGITILAASGDNGAGCGKGGLFVANFPASLPHITSVGGTETCNVGSSVAGFSSGGFSATYARPDWQKDAVEEFLKSATLPPSSVFNSTGRAYPDVSACGDVQICSRGICGLPVGGTSCACPIFGGVMGLANDARLAQGKSALGFLAPALYKAWANDKTSFDDVTSGSTQGCSGHSWKAQSGWDATSGLGTPNFRNLVKQLLSF